MDKVNGNSQTAPLWEMKKQARGHYSSVDNALRAHRQRNEERQSRVNERLNIVRNMQTEFFPQSNVMNRLDLVNESLQAQTFQNQANINNQIQQTPDMVEIPDVPQTQNFNPVEMDEIYSEASMGSVADNALGVVQKEIANPEETPIDDMPKGSYIDYTV